MTIEEAVNDFLKWNVLRRGKASVRGYGQDLAKFCIYVREMKRPVESLTPEECLSWLLLLEEIGFHPNTINRKSSTLRMFFGFCKLHGLRVLNPDLIPAPRIQFNLPRVATEEDYLKILSMFKGRGYAHARNRALIRVIHDTFARSGEIASLNIEDIDETRQSAIIKTEKSRGTVPFREIFWTKETHEELMRWVRIRGEFLEKDNIEREPLFIGVKRGRGPSKGQRMTPGAISDIFRRYSEKAGLSKTLNAHSFRHRGGRELTRKGVNAFGISSILGHVDPKSSYRYSMIFGKEREDLYRKYVGK